MCKKVERYLASEGFQVDMTNVYRTDEYIVFQKLSICENDKGYDFLMSTDTYYKRNSRRDKLYEEAFSDKGPFVNGKRIRTSGFVRIYVYK